MQVSLDAHEIGLLRELLESRLNDLRVEVRRTEDPTYHDQLRELEQRIRNLLAKLQSSPAAP